MGYLAAVNIHQLMKQRISGHSFDFMKLDEIPPMIGLAVSKKAVSYWPEGGTTSGEDVMEAFFGDDLGFTSKRIAYERYISTANRCHSLLEPSTIGEEV